MTLANLHSLKAFLSGYFHEDWESEASNPEEVIAHYLASKASKQDMELIIIQIDNYLKDARVNSVNEYGLLRDLGCYYLPSADGLTVRDWLLNVAKQLRNSYS